MKPSVSTPVRAISALVLAASAAFIVLGLIRAAQLILELAP